MSHVLITHHAKRGLCGGYWREETKACSVGGPVLVSLHSQYVSSHSPRSNQQWFETTPKVYVEIIIHFATNIAHMWSTGVQPA